MAEHYLLIKQLHMSSALLSISLFILRLIWMLGWPAMLQWKPARIVPHVVDTVLLLTAVVLAWVAQQYPFVHGWLTAKVVALIVYIVLGTIALKRGPNKPVRLLAGLAAVLTFGYILAVAFSKQVLPF